MVTELSIYFKIFYLFRNKWDFLPENDIMLYNKKSDIKGKYMR